MVQEKSEADNGSIPRAGTFTPSADQMRWVLRVLNDVDAIPDDPVARFQLIFRALQDLTGARAAGLVFLTFTGDKAGGRWSRESNVVQKNVLATDPKQASRRRDVGLSNAVSTSALRAPPVVVNAINELFKPNDRKSAARSTPPRPLPPDTEWDAAANVLLSWLWFLPSGNRHAHPAEASVGGGLIWLLQSDRAPSEHDRGTVHLLHSALAPLWHGIIGSEKSTNGVTHVKPRAVVTLTERQHEALQPLLAGRSERQAAQVVGMSVHTFHEHVKQLYKKFHVSSRAELMAKVLGQG